jgi:hypothetical protein
MNSKLRQKLAYALRTTKVEGVKVGLKFHSATDLAAALEQGKRDGLRLCDAIEDGGASDLRMLVEKWINDFAPAPGS